MKAHANIVTSRVREMRTRRVGGATWPCVIIGLKKPSARPVEKRRVSAAAYFTHLCSLLHACYASTTRLAKHKWCLIIIIIVISMSTPTLCTVTSRSYRVHMATWRRALERAQRVMPCRTVRILILLLTKPRVSPCQRGLLRRLGSSLAARACLVGAHHKVPSWDHLFRPYADQP